MRRIQRLMTLHFGAGAPTRAIARELGISHSTVREYLARIAAAGITWPLPAEVTDEELERRLFVNGGVRAGARHYVEPDWAAVTRELKRPGVTLMILWEEYRAVHPDGYAYSRYCQLFREFERRLSPSMRQHHVAGDKAFVDFSGKKIPIIDPTTGVVREAEIFVAVLGASNLTYAEATWTQGLPGLDRRACAHVPLLGCELPPAGARQSQERRAQGLVLRSRGQPQLWCHGCTLWCRHPASTAVSPEGQSQSRGRSTHRSVLSAGPAAQPDSSSRSPNAMPRSPRYWGS